MKNSKKFIILTFGLILFISSFIIGITYKETSYKEESSHNQVSMERTLAIMLETDLGSGEYEMVTNTDWPTDGYLFNDTLSKCENGGDVSWDSELNTVIMTSNVSDKCYIYFDKYTSVVIDDYSIDLSGTSIVVKLNATAGDGTISKYFYSKDNGATYIESSENTHTFSNLEKGIYYIKAYVQDSNEKNSLTVSKTIELKNMPLKNYIIALYNGTQGNNNIYYHDGTLTNGINDYSYRYSGPSSEVNNFVCLDPTEDPCTSNNYFRIIGVIDGKVKLIRVNSVGVQQWHTSAAQVTFANSSIKSNLNSTSYLNTLGDYKTKVSNGAWYVGNYNYGTFSAQLPKDIYNQEKQSTYTTFQIGLMYVSDYGFAASQSAWGTKMSSYASYSSNNWMYSGVDEWTIDGATLYSHTYSTGNFTIYYYAFTVNSSGNTVNLYYSNTYNGSVIGTNTANYRPTFFLNADVSYIGGSGTSSDPIRIE